MKMINVLLLIKNIKSYTYYKILNKIYNNKFKINKMIRYKLLQNKKIKILNIKNVMNFAKIKLIFYKNNNKLYYKSNKNKIIKSKVKKKN